MTKPDNYFTSPERSLAMHEAPADGISSLALVNALLRRRVLLAGLPLVLLIGVSVVQLARPRKYASSAAFVPQGADNRWRLSGLAAQFGVALPTAEADRSPAFYVELIGSREILGPLVTSTFVFDARGEHHSGTLEDLLRVREPDTARRHEEGLRRLSEAVTPRRSLETNIVTVTVTTEWAPLSQQILTRLFDALNEFNLTTRRTQAASERAFAERRLADAALELREAENRLREFLRQNRQYQDSPDLTIEYERLQRTVGFRQQLYTTIAQSYEQARIDEVRDTPVLTVIARPNLPARPVRRGLLTNGAIAVAAGFVLAVLVSIAGALVQRRAPDAPSEVEEFAALRQDAVADLRNPFRPIRRAFRRRPPDADSGSLSAG